MSEKKPSALATVVTIAFVIAAIVAWTALARVLKDSDPPSPPNPTPNLAAPGNPEARRGRIAFELAGNLRDAGFSASVRDAGEVLAIRMVPRPDGTQDYCKGVLERIREGGYWKGEEAARFPEVLRVAGFRRLDCRDSGSRFTLDL